MMPAEIIDVAAAGALRLRVTWSDGISGEVDLAPIASPGTILERLREPAFLACVRVGDGGGSVEWPGELDLGGDSLLVEAAAAGTLRLAPKALLDWRREVGASKAEMARWLGVDEQRYAELEAAAHPLPQTIALAYRALRDRMPVARELWQARAGTRRRGARADSITGQAVSAR